MLDRRQLNNLRGSTARLTFEGGYAFFILSRAWRIYLRASEEYAMNHQRANLVFLLAGARLALFSWRTRCAMRETFKRSLS